MINSLYSNKDIFLRELVANAADAIDKARFEALKNQGIAAEWEIRIEPDKNKRILKISDNGIGMTREEVQENIGTIAKSGTKAFLDALEDKKLEDSPELIGQFGVGFYSAFMVADKVELVTKKAGSDSAVRWESDGKSEYTISDAKKASQGTEISVHLKEDMKSYLEEWKIKEIIKKYSDFIEHPVKMKVTRKEDGTEKEEDETLNSQKAIWLRPPADISEDEYKQFYSHLAHFDSEPLKHIHYSAEGTSEFKALLYVPSKAPFDLFMPEKNKGLHLYIKRIFITDECKGLIPDYLRFVKGVVDSSDLPLNISREMLQDNPMIRKINKNIVIKILNELKKLLDKQRGDYETFYREFGRTLKEGLHTDFDNKNKLQELVMFETLNSKPGELVTLKEYVSAMPENQKEIYYATGENRNMLENSPHLELLKSKGFDVLLMTDPIDEWVTQSLLEYDKKKLKAVGKGELELDEDSKKEASEEKEKAEKEHKKLLEYLKETLKDNVKDVRFSTRLTDSACCLVGEDFDPSAHMERIFKAMNRDMPKTKRILELNPRHPLVTAFQELYDKTPENKRLGEFANMLYDQALLTEGTPLPDPLNFTRKIAELMVIGVKEEL
jgi:molecular chaperone HtpG